MRFLLYPLTTETTACRQWRAVWVSGAFQSGFNIVTKFLIRNESNDSLSREHAIECAINSLRYISEGCNTSAGHIHCTKFPACWSILHQVSDTGAYCYFGIIGRIISAPASVWWCSTDLEKPCLPWPSAVLQLFQRSAFETSKNTNRGTQRHNPEDLHLHITLCEPQVLYFLIYKIIQIDLTWFVRVTQSLLDLMNRKSDLGAFVTMPRQSFI
jgi:hypothetical protein